MLRSTLSTHLPREARDTLFLLGVIALVVLPQSANLPLWCSVLTGGVLLWRGLLALSSRPLPGVAWRIALLALALAGTYFSHQTLIGKDAGVTMVVILLALKTLELRARRDAFVIFFLGFFTMLTNFLYSQSLLTATAMLLALLGLLTALVNAHMPVGRPALMQSARIAGGMALAGAPIMLALFLLFPRLAPLWGTPNDNMSGRTGLSNTMRVGTIAQLALDESIAARVRFDGDAAPPRAAMYFRGPVLSRFDGREWSAVLPWEGGLLSGALRVRGAPLRYEVTLEPSNRPWLLTLDAAPQAPELPADSNWRVIRTSELQWMTHRPIGDLLRYRAQSYIDFESGPLRNERGLHPLRELPSGRDPRTVALASDMLASARAAVGADVDPTPALVRMALDRLQTGGYSYTLEPGLYGDHTADEFWFVQKSGFCEHIASSFVVLMRAAGVPARVVTGFQGGEANQLDGYWVLRNSDAHAWAEVWQEGRGWWRVDPTASVAPSRIGSLARLSAPPGLLATAVGAVSPTLVQNLRAVWEAVNNGWNQWVLNYTQSRQLDLLKNLGFESPSLADLAKLLAYLVGTAGLASALWALWERSRTDPWLRLLGKARRKLMRLGIELPTQAPPRQMAQALTQRYGDDALATERAWLLQLEAQRYAPHPALALPALRRQWRGLRWESPQRSG